MEKFCSIKYEAFDYVCENKANTFVEEYIYTLRVEQTYDFYKHVYRARFSEEMRKCIMHLYQIAENQGFVVMDSFNLNGEMVIL
jgi:predicted enzyme related to lactoylglutathione lyase